MPVVCFSLVIYKHSLESIEPLLESICSFSRSVVDLRVILSVYNASPVRFHSADEFQISSKLESVDLFYEKGINIGFGRANNRNFHRCFLRHEDLFVVVNPDIQFAPGDLVPMICWLFSCSDCSCVSPLILLQDGSIQYSAKRDPTFLSLLLGRFPFLLKFPFFTKYNSRHKNLDQDYRVDIIESSYLSGCFLVIPAWAYLAVGGFCRHYFLHVEDADLVRRLSSLGRTVHNPIGRVIHGWARGSHFSIKQSLSLVRSYCVYSWIWGPRLF